MKTLMSLFVIFLITLSSVQANTGDEKPIGFNKSQVKLFLQKVVFPDKEVTQTLVDTLFDVKASVFGGTNEKLTVGELAAFVKSFNTAKEFWAPIPLLSEKLSQKTEQATVTEFTGAIQVLTENTLATIDDPSGNVALPVESLIKFVHELSLLLDFNFSLDWMAFYNQIGNIVSQSNAATSLIPSPILLKTLRLAARVTSGVAAFNMAEKESPTAHAVLASALSAPVHSSLDELLDMRGGSIPYNELENLFDSIPQKTLPYDRRGMSGSLKPLIIKVLGAQSRSGFDKPALNSFIMIGLEWAHGILLLDQIFTEYKLDRFGVSVQEFTAACEKFMSDDRFTAVDKRRVKRLMRIAKSYRAVFQGPDREMTLVPFFRHSIASLEKWHLFDLASHLTTTSYCDRATLKCTTENATEFVNDIRPILISLHLIDPTIPDIAKKLVMQGDLFTLASNGDLFLDQPEVANLMAVMLSTSTAAARVRSYMTVDGSCLLDKKDPLGWTYMKADCFRQKYFSQVASFWDHIPNLLINYSNLSVKDQARLQNNLEKTARRSGVSDQAVGGSDTMGFALVIQLIESMYLRFDLDLNQTLDAKELVAASGLFMKTIQTFLPDQLDERTALAAFTYTLKFGRLPDSKTAKGALHFLWWKSWRKFWTLKVTRAQLYSALEIL